MDPNDLIKRARLISTGRHNEMTGRIESVSVFFSVRSVINGLQCDLENSSILKVASSNQ